MKINAVFHSSMLILWRTKWYAILLVITNNDDANKRTMFFVYLRRNRKDVVIALVMKIANILHVNSI